jgi:GntR family transcriptional regulator
MTLDKGNPTPLYYQMAELLREQIKSGELKPGHQLPSERELSEQAGISRMTVRQAIGYLVHLGLLVVKKGIGTFVSEPKLVHNTIHLLSFTEEMMHGEGAVPSQVLEQGVVRPPPGVAAQLALQSDQLTIKIVRLRLLEEVPLLLETIFIPVALCPGLEHVDLARASLYTLLKQQYGLHLKRTRQTLEVIIANDYESDLFGIEPGTAMILVEGVTYLDQGQPVEYFKAIYRGDRFKFELESQRHVAQTASITPRLNVLLD